MKTTSFVPAALAAFVLSTGAALAADPALFADNAVVQTVTTQLEAQGFVIVDVQRTLLGRYKIEALSADGTQRELVISANNEVLRDQIDQVAVQGYDDDVAGDDMENGDDNEVDDDNEADDDNEDNGNDNESGSDNESDDA
ncbi:MAG: hypothetical protein COA53_11170 [Rhodobacteraceae bacterium]|nr:MAG: hypothetical protein COA53_11170 [Paracoccaceae bacterium]